MSNGAFTILDFEQFNNEILEADREFYLRIANKLKVMDSSGAMQTFILLSKFGELALKHKEVVLSKYIELIREQKELMGYYLRIVEAGAGNISPAANIVSILTTVLNFINLSALLVKLGDFQDEFRIYAEKPLLAYISEIAQRTESIKDNNLDSAYDTMQSSIILPDKIMR